jgi:hypothetical protein
MPTRPRGGANRTSGGSGIPAGSKPSPGRMAAHYVGGGVRLSAHDGEAHFVDESEGSVMNLRRPMSMVICPSHASPLRWSLSRENSTGTTLWSLPLEGLLHCGISVVSADGFMAEMGHELKFSK